MKVRLRVIFFLVFMVAFAYLLAKTITPYWTMVLLTLIFLYVGSIFFFIYYDFKDELNKTIKPWPTVSILIPNFNGEATVKKCVESCKAMRYPKKTEVIVVDDASTDNSYEILKKISGIKLLRQKKNSGKAAALNRAIAESKGEIVACIDSDTYPSEDCLEKMVPLFAEKKVGAVTGLIRVHNPSNFLQRVQEIEYLIGFAFYQSMLSIINAAFVTPGPMCLYRRQMLVESGGYDEENITEDMEIALRIQASKYKIRACHNASIYTEVPRGIRQWLKQRTRWYRGRVYNTWKYRHMLFNQEYGALGTFSFPITFFLDFASVFVFFVISAMLVDTLRYAILMALAWAKVSAFPVLQAPVVIINSSAFFFYFVLICVFAFSTYFSFVIAKQKISFKNIPPMLFIIFVYSVGVAFVWLYAFLNELNRSEYKW
ncbi:MAG: glycosyltransferase [Candidatus Diapherotrites archaeon]